MFIQLVATLYCLVRYPRTLPVSCERPLQITIIDITTHGCLKLQQSFPNNTHIRQRQNQPPNSPLPSIDNEEKSNFKNNIPNQPNQKKQNPNSKLPLFFNSAIAKAKLQTNWALSHTQPNQQRPNKINQKFTTIGYFNNPIRNHNQASFNTESQQTSTQSISISRIYQNFS